MSSHPIALDDDELRRLMIAYQAADPAAIDLLVRALSPALLRFLSTPDLGPGDVEDILQDFWMRLHRARQTYRPAEPVLPWIFAVARHTRLDAYRRRQRLLAHEVHLAAIPEDLYRTEQPDMAEGEFLRVLESLPESQREVIIMLKVSGMSLQDVAKAKSTTVGAIKQKAHRAYDKLREVLGNDAASLGQSRRRAQR